jgi:hypothetical protein
MKMNNLIITALVGCLVAFSQASASTISVDMAGANLNFSDPDGGGAGLGTLTDAGVPADALSAMVFYVGGSTVGNLTSPPDALTLDMSVTGVPNIAVPAPNSSTFVTAPAGGSLTLEVNSGTILDLDLDNVEVVFSRINFSTFDIRFQFVGTVGSIVSQNLPFGLSLADPVTVSFSMQGTSTESGGYLTSFLGSGTGELSSIPEPATLGMALLSVLSLAGCRRRG